MRNALGCVGNRTLRERIAGNELGSVSLHKMGFPGG